MHSQENTEVPFDTQGALPVESVLVTGELGRRPSRPPDYETENRALVILAQSLSEQSSNILQVLTDTILTVVRAGSAGLSLLTDDNQKFWWPAISGKWKTYIGGGTPRHFGPCGDVLDRNRSLLFSHPEKRYTYLQVATPPAEEALLVPFYSEGRAVGTIWAISHDQSRKFDGEDERLMKSLSTFASSAFQIVTTLEVDQRLKLQWRTFETTLSAIVDFAYVFDRSGRFLYANQALLDLWGLKLEEAVGKNFFELKYPDELAGRLQRQIQQVFDTKEGVRDEARYVSPAGVDGYYEYIFRPVFDSKGNVEAVAGSTRDITERKQAEERYRHLAESLEMQVHARTEELRQRNAEVLRQTEQLRDLWNRLQNSQDSERRHVARELHDSAGQTITALAIMLDDLARNLQGFPMSRKAKESQALVHELSKEIRTMSYLLHPPLLDETGLSGAMAWYIGGVKERSNLEVDFHISSDFGRLSEEMELAIFRIVQECLTNIHRHAGAGKASINLTRGPSDVSLTIQDDGIGMSAQKLADIQCQRSGVGIIGMRERIRSLEGTMKIESNEQGTRIAIRLPHAAAGSQKVAIA